jgi:hypothetical protein
MKTAIHDDGPQTPLVSTPRSGWPAMLSACGFIAFYLLTDVLTSSFATTGLPLPNDPSSQVRDWFADNQAAAVLMGASQAVSVLFLAGFVVALAIPRARPWGLVATGLMIASSGCAWALAAVAPSASLDTVEVLRRGNFITGGTAHVLALSGFVFIASRDGAFGRAKRVLSVVALVISALSVSSLLVFQGAAFILLGRVLCMAWTLSVGISLVRQRRSTTP